MIEKVIAIYPGRFQPFGMQHKVVYDWAAKKFGVNNTFIATSDKSDNIKSPFNFASKKSIMQLFGLQNKVTQVKNTYNAAEITGKFNENTTAVVYVVGEKDQDRLSKGKYFLPYPGDTQVLNPYTQNGYYIVGPKNKEVIPGHGEMNGTNVRKVLGSKSIPVSEKHKLFKSIFGTYSKTMADFIIDKLMSLQETKIFSKNWWSSTLNEDVESVLEIKLPTNVWKDFNLASLANEDIDVLWDMYTSTYSKAGLDFSANDAKELQSKYKAVYLEDVDGDSVADAFIIYKPTQFGNKISLLGTNDKKEAKKELLGKLFRLLKTSGWFIEASAKMEDILSARPEINVVTDDEVIRGLVGHKGLEIMDNGYYKRKLDKVDKLIVKRLYGKPKTTAVKEGYMSPDQQQSHSAKIEKLKAYLRKHINQSVVYDYDKFPKTVYGVKMPTQESLLKEGGAGGHVLHPFNLPQVKTGKDLIKVFDDTAKSLETVPARVKVDGVNTTLKLVTRNGKLQFAMDRGSKKEEDLQGVTVDELGKRFPEGHGMLKIGKLVLTAFNDALPKIAGDLKAIGMSDPNILLNLETVLLEAGKANVIGYERNFFAIHGLMKADMINGRRVIKEIPVNAQAIEKIVDKAKPVMNKIGFDLYGFKKLQPKIKQDINYSGALNTKLTVKYNDDTEVSKSLKDWLSKASNPIDDTVKLNTGKSEPVMTKKYYLDILNQNVNLDDLTTDPKEQKKIIDTAVFYHTTVLLGDVILKALTSEVGDVEKHEGIMIRDNKISKDPFKITGHFIVQGMASGFRKK